MTGWFGSDFISMSIFKSFRLTSLTLLSSIKVLNGFADNLMVSKPLFSNISLYFARCLSWALFQPRIATIGFLLYVPALVTTAPIFFNFAWNCVDSLDAILCGTNFGMAIPSLWDQFFLICTYIQYCLMFTKTNGFDQARRLKQKKIGDSDIYACLCWDSAVNRLIIILMW